MIMLSKPKHGWTTIEVFGVQLGTASYLYDVPMLTLDAFIQYFSNIQEQEKASLSITYDAEGYSFGLVTWNDTIYAIDDCGDTEPFVRLSEVKTKDGQYVSVKEGLQVLGAELIDDIQSNIDDWAWWNPDTETQKEANNQKILLIEKCSILVKLIKKT